MKKSQAIYFGQSDMDLRSPDDTVRFGDMRDILNFRSTGRGRKRMGGWEKLFSTESIDDYNNEDLHDKDLALSSHAFTDATFDPTSIGDKPIVHMRETVSSDGGRFLIAATGTEIYCHSPAYQNWRVLGWGKSGGNKTRKVWRSCQFGRYTFFTNNFNKPLYWGFADFPDQDSGQAVKEIDELALVGITRARAIEEFKGFLFIGDIVMDGIRYPTGIAWSDYENPLAWDPLTLNADGSSRLSGMSNLDLSGESVVAMKKQGDYLVVYCERSIWRVTYTGDTETIFNFEKVYSGKDSVFYPNTLVQVGDFHFYMGKDDIYSFNLSSRVPERTEFIHKASPVIYNNLTSDCELPVAGYNESENEVWFSWATSGATANSQTLIVNVNYGKVHRVDYGFSALLFAHASQWLSVEEFLIDKGICCNDDFSISAGNLQGGFREAPSGVCAPIDDGISNTEERWAAVCEALGDMTIDDLCESCPGIPVFIMASESDKCLKQYSKDIYFREEWDTGWTYDENGYESKMVPTASDFGTSKEKAITNVIVDFNANANESPPLQLSVKLGLSENYDDEAKTFYEELGPEDLAPAWKETDTGNAANSRPSDSAEFPCFWAARWIRLLLSIGNEDGDLRTGGDIEISKAEIFVSQHEK